MFIFFWIKTWLFVNISQVSLPPHPEGQDSFRGFSWTGTSIIHYLFICQKEEVKTIRQKFIPRYCTLNRTEYKMKGMLMFCHIELYKNLSNFLKTMILFFIICNTLYMYLYVYICICCVLLYTCLSDEILSCLVLNKDRT